MTKGSHQIWAFQLDRFCAILGGLLPSGIVLGAACFESIIGLIVLCWIIRSMVAKENPLRQIIKHPLVIPWIAWYASIVISLLVNSAWGKGWAHNVAFIRYLLLVMALLDISQRLPVFKYLLYGLSGGVILAAVNMMSAHIFGYDLFGSPLIDYIGMLKEAERIAGITAYAAPFFLAWGMFDKGLSIKKKSVIIGIGLVALAMLFQTEVRTAILASLTGLSFCIVYFFRRHLLLAIVSMLILSSVFFMGISQARRMMWDPTSLYERIYIWKVSWAMWLEHPVFGVGISSFQDVYREMAASGDVAEFVASDSRVFHLPEAIHAHNLFFMLISSTGILGLATFLWLFINSVRLVVKNINGFRVGLVSYPVVLLVAGITGFNIYHSWYQALLAFLMVLIGSTMDIRPQTSDVRH
jgi:O-antigen ligase